MWAKCGHGRPVRHEKALTIRVRMRIVRADERWAQRDSNPRKGAGRVRVTRVLAVSGGAGMGDVGVSCGGFVGEMWAREGLRDHAYRRHDDPHGIKR